MLVVIRGVDVTELINVKEEEIESWVLYLSFYTNIAFLNDSES